MPREIRFDFPLPHGLHARPASHLQELANRFTSKIEITNTRSGHIANAKSVLSMVSADVRAGDACVIAIAGQDEASAETELQRFISDVLPTCDDDDVATVMSDNEQPLPRSLVAAGLGKHHRGKPISRGIGWGKIVLMRGRTLPDVASDETGRDPKEEKSRFVTARESVRISIRSRIADSRNRNEIGVLNAHLAIVDDPALIDHVADSIARSGCSASHAVRASAQHFAATLHASESAYLRERAMDVQDVGGQLLDVLAGRSATTSASGIKLTEPSIVVADRLTPSEFLSLDRNLLKGLVLREGGTTSHTIILAKSIGVPTLVGISEIGRLREGQETLVDANVGVAIHPITDSLRRYYQREGRTLAQANDWEFSSQASQIAICAAVASAEEVEAAMQRCAHGVGLFRTELLFLHRESPPSEEEQFEVYSRAARAMNDEVLTIRLLDAGGDKPMSFLRLPPEPNPFLGYRGARIYEHHRELIRNQLRAILRASEFADIHILVPMVSRIEELQFVRTLFDEVRAELGGEFIHVLLGAMIEVPSCAFMMDELCQHADFFSIGSNDLAQYFLAADRDNASVSSIYGWSHPAFLRMVSKVVARARVRGRAISLCGEMADDPRAWPILVALGLESISLPVRRLAAARRAISKMHSEQCTRLLHEAMACATRTEVEALLDEFTSSQRVAPLLDRLLVLQSDAATKHEVIKEVSDALWLADRTSNRFAVEEAIWAREDTYSTGFGHGFALPHCKSDDVTSNSIAIAKLSQPIDWGSNDGRPVDVVICVAMRASDYGKEHLRVFAQLSRMVMRDEFRDRVRAIASADELVKFLSENLGLDQR